MASAARLLLSHGGCVSARVTAAGPSPRRTPRRSKATSRALPEQTPRARILAAAERLVSANGAERLTATAITAGARVSRTTFYATFADREDCLLALFDEVSERLRAAMLAAYAAESSWLDGVRAALGELLSSLDEQPSLARFLVIGGVSGDSALVVRRRRILAELARALEAASPVPDTKAAAVPFGSQALVSGAASIIHSRLLEDPAPALLELSPSLMAVLVLPFVGEGVARAELSRREPSATPGRPADGIFASRVTDRTARVVRVIAQSPGLTNRAVAERSGIADEGQASKLLARLSGLGVIVNDARPGDRAGANAWRLTKAGSVLVAELPHKRER